MDQPTPRGTRRMTRRDTLRLFAAGSAAVLAPALLGRPESASAARVWCRADPLFQVGNKLVDVTIGTYDDMFAMATGPVQIVLTTPPGVAVRLVYADNGFGFGYAISYATDAALVGGLANPQVHVQVTAPATEALPVSVYYSTLTAVTQRLEFASTEYVGVANQAVAVLDVQAVPVAPAETPAPAKTPVPAGTPAPTRSTTSTSSSKKRKNDGD